MSENFIINYASLCGVVGVFGIATNVVTISVFVKQGVNNTMTISFLGLAISDICSLVAVLWVTVSLNPFFKSTVFNATPLVHITAGWPRGCFADVTSMITAYITGERCLCAFTPLKVKEFITPGRSVLVVCFIYVLMIVCLVPEYVSVYIDWKLNQYSNLTSLSQLSDGKRTLIEGVTPLLYSVFGIVSFFLVTFFTCVLVWKLKRTAEWRQQSTSHSEQSQVLTVRDQRTIKLIVLMASIFIVSCIPSLGITVLEFVEPDFSVLGRYDNIFFSLWLVSFICETIEASGTFFIFYTMSSKFRETFHQIFNKCAFKRPKMQSLIV